MIKAYEKFIELAIKKGIETDKEFKQLKRKIAKDYKIGVPRNEDLRKSYFAMKNKEAIKPNKTLEDLLILKRTRTLSGVSVIAVLTKCFKCRGNCIYCPEEKGMPKSYLSNEPAVMRAIRLNFDPYEQTIERVRVLEYNGHDASKIELIVMGGTFSHICKKYQYWFILNCFKAANDFSNPAVKKKLAVSYKLTLETIRKKLEVEKNKNILAKHRIVGLTLETRPDEINVEELIKFRRLGCTRVEIGVQSVFDSVLTKNLRGHKIKATIEATKLLKDCGFKINYHMMPGLLGSSFKKDCQMFQELFSNENYCPDMLKIYPCVVIKGSKLYQLWKKGEYRPYSNATLKKLIIKIKALIPQYVRITRLIRDIPTTSIIAGPNIPNLRGILKEEQVKCSCIRCREIGRVTVNKDSGQEKVFLDRIEYNASQGKEIFLQFVEGKRKNLHAFLRLRIPACIIQKENSPISELKGCAIIREVHSYGAVAPVGKNISHTSQHKGWGKLLVKEAEKIAQEEWGLKKMAVIASEGTKEYYEKIGYRNKDLYMLKELKF